MPVSYTMCAVLSFLCTYCSIKTFKQVNLSFYVTNIYKTANDVVEKMHAF